MNKQEEAIKQEAGELDLFHSHLIMVDEELDELQSLMYSRFGAFLVRGAMFLLRQARKLEPNLW